MDLAEEEIDRMHEWKEEMMEEKNELEVPPQTDSGSDPGSTRKGLIPPWHPLKVFYPFPVAIATGLHVYMCDISYEACVCVHSTG